MPVTESPRVHVLGHQTDEMTQTQRRFQDATVGEAEPIKGGVHGANDNRRGVLGVEGGGAGGVEFTRIPLTSSCSSDAYGTVGRRNWRAQRYRLKPLSRTGTCSTSTPSSGSSMPRWAIDVNSRASTPVCLRR